MRKKSFYVSLAVGVIAICAVGVMTAQNTTSQEQPENTAQIEAKEQKNDTKETGTDSLSSAGGISTTESAISVGDALSTDSTPSVGGEPSVTNTPSTGDTPSADSSSSTGTETAENTSTEEVTPVMSGADSLQSLSFHEEDGLIWPVTGEILLSYSMESAVYFKTLAQYKCNPALVIAAQEDTEVLSAGKCIVTEISENEETGVTMTATLGNGYEVVYGQLKEVTKKVGDTIEKGSVLGKIAKPTKYYVTEGANLYFQVLEDGETVDPLLLLE